jgi:hypothetical protein
MEYSIHHAPEMGLKAPPCYNLDLFLRIDSKDAGGNQLILSLTASAA